MQKAPSLLDDLRQLQLWQTLYKKYGSCFHLRHNPTIEEATQKEASYQQKTIQGRKQTIIKPAL